MKCPICGEQLRPGKKDPNYLLCYNCKKKYKAPQNSAPKKEAKVSKSSAPKQKSKTRKVKVQEDDEQRYSNVPPKKVRDKREDEMRRAYDEMLAVGDGKSRRKKQKDAAAAKKRQRDYEDDYYEDDDDYYDDDDRVSKAPIIILGIAIIVVAAVIAYMILFK